MRYRYRLTLRPLSAEEGGGWLAEVPDLPGCMSDGADVAGYSRLLDSGLSNGPTG
jgi:predicted RNase H-like HicB family nuclease